MCGMRALGNRRLLGPSCLHRACTMLECHASSHLLIHTHTHTHVSLLEQSMNEPSKVHTSKY